MAIFTGIQRTAIWLKNMSSGGSAYEGTMESHNVDYDIAPETVEFRRSPHRKFSSLSCARHPMTSNTAVHELLECPVCLNVMYPPIHQVSSFITQF